MTKKDYLKIADVLRKHKEATKYAETASQTRVQAIIDDFEDMLEADNPRFDRQRFIDYINKSTMTVRKCPYCGITYTGNHK